MSKKANPTAVGAFALGALILLVGVILVFGSDRFMKRSMKAVLYFDESVEGLDVGAPVIFRGVKVGAVTDIQLVYDVARKEFRIPVVYFTQLVGLAFGIDEESLGIHRGLVPLSHEVASHAEVGA